MSESTDIVAFTSKSGAGKNKLIALGVVATICLYQSSAMAGTGGSEFDTLLQMVTDWSEGTLGKTIAISGLVMGLGYTAFGGGARWAIGGIMAAAGFSYGPGVVDGIVSFSLPMVGPLIEVATLPNYTMY